MAYFFIIIPLLALLVILLIPTILFSLVRVLFSILGFSIGGRRRGRRNSSESAQGSAYDSTSYRHKRTSAADGQRRKVFDKDEGEYVDFEEFEDDK